jgi:hypothetical protein
MIFFRCWNIREVRYPNQFPHPKNGIKGRSEFVAYIGEEKSLCGTGIERFILQLLIP